MARELRVSVQVDDSQLEDALSALDAGFPVLPIGSDGLKETPPGATVITVTSLGDYADGESQRAVVDTMTRVLAEAGIEAVTRSTGLVISGGSANHRWCPACSTTISPSA